MIRKQLLSAILSGAVLGIAFHLPDTAGAALLGWCGAVLTAYALSAGPNPYRALFLSGCISNATGFIWLEHTIQHFGGFSLIPALGIFLLFVTLSSHQHLLFVLFHRSLPRWCDAGLLRLPIAWVSAEWFSLRIFPWHIGNSQIAFRPFVQIADIGGAPLTSFVMMWTIAAFVALVSRRGLLRSIPALLAFIGAIVYGSFRLAELENAHPPTTPVAIVQANVSTVQKADVRFIQANLGRYQSLSQPFADGARLIIWPETVIQEWIPTWVRSVRLDERLASVATSSRMLVGSLTYDSPEELHNSALAILADGTVLPAYHKRILMPFGEYIPFGDALPWLRSLMPTTGDFTAGKGPAVFTYPARAGVPEVIASPLICYEDIVPRLARESTKMGANLLVNLTNDAWFGDSAAPYQHHLLAAFRAIENRRTLIRSTNSGFTAIVDPSGKTTFSLAPFSEGIILADVPLLSYKTVYTQFVGDAPWWALGLFSTLAALWSFACNRKLEGRCPVIV